MVFRSKENRNHGISKKMNGNGEHTHILSLHDKQIDVKELKLYYSVAAVSFLCSFEMLSLYPRHSCAPRSTSQICYVVN